MTELNDASAEKGNALLGLQVLSDFGDQITAALLALCILDISNSTIDIGFIHFINTVGFILFTMLGGYLGDRISNKKLLCYSDLGRGFFVLLMITALSQKSIALIYFTSFFHSLLSSLHRPAKFSLWAKSVPPKRLELYNCFSELSTNASIIVGPLIASFLVIHQLINWGFAVDALTFFTCAAVFALIVSEGYNTKVSAKHRSWFAGFRIIFRDQELCRYVAYDAIQMLAHGAFNATFLVLAQRDFGWSKTEYSYYLSISAVFAIIGATLGATKYVANMNAVAKLIGCTFTSALSLGMVLYYKSFLICSLAFGVCNTVAIIAMIVSKTKIQMHGNNFYSESLASVLAARIIIIKTATLLGTGGCLIISHYLGLEKALWFFIIPLVIGFLPFTLRQKETVEADVQI